MTHIEIVNKIIGRIEPAGDASRDDAFFENLKIQCALVDKLMAQIIDVAERNKGSYYGSVKRAGEYASKFLTETIGIKELP